MTENRADIRGIEVFWAGEERVFGEKFGDLLPGIGAVLIHRLCQQQTFYF
jgi:hypothetical protein